MIARYYLRKRLRKRVQIKAILSSKHPVYVYRHKSGGIPKNGRSTHSRKQRKRSSSINIRDAMDTVKLFIINQNRLSGIFAGTMAIMRKNLDLQAIHGWLQ